MKNGMLVAMMGQGDLEEQIAAAVIKSQDWHGEHMEIEIGCGYSITIQYWDNGESGRGILCDIGQYDFDGDWTCYTTLDEGLTDRDEDPTEAQIKAASERIAANVKDYLADEPDAADFGDYVVVSYRVSSGYYPDNEGLNDLKENGPYCGDYEIDEDTFEIEKKFEKLEDAGKWCDAHEPEFDGDHYRCYEVYKIDWYGLMPA